IGEFVSLFLLSIGIEEFVSLFLLSIGIEEFVSLFLLSIGIGDVTDVALVDFEIDFCGTGGGIASLYLVGEVTLLVVGN
ncbi:hypothetical protein GLOIN_2v1672514, partial [Rhizophagus irregularis DAOM 181602=DAOM 197198]